MKQNNSRVNTPFQINDYQLKNRKVSELNTATFSNDTGGFFSTQSVDFYSNQTMGAGMVVAKSKKGDVTWGINKQNELIKSNYGKGQIKQLRKMVERVQRFGTKVFAELNAEAGKYLPAFMLVKRTKKPILNRHWEDDMVVLNPSMEKEKVIDEYVKLATMARITGFDGVQVDISTGFNTKYEYVMDGSSSSGNSLSLAIVERFEFAQKIVEAIKIVCGDDFPVVLNIEVDNDFVALTTNQAQSKYKYQNHTSNGQVINGLMKLEEVGYDAINLNFTSPGYDVQPQSNRVVKRNLVLVNKIKNALDIPIILQLDKQYQALANKVLNKGFVDAIGLDNSLLMQDGGDNNSEQANYWIA